MYKKTVYILGAGASAGAGYPIGNNFMKAIMQEKAFGRILAEVLHENLEDDLYEKDFQESEESIKKFNEVCENNKNKLKKEDQDDVEKYLKWYQDVEGKPSLFFLRLMYWYFWHLHNNQRQAPRYTQTFVWRIFNPDDIIISFNYDLLIEQAFRQPRNEFKKENVQGIDIVYDPKTTGGPKILKPHGSVNWLVGISPLTSIHIGDPMSPYNQRTTAFAKNYLKLMWQDNTNYIWETPQYFEWKRDDNIKLSPLIKWWFQTKNDNEEDSDWKEYKSYFDSIWDACIEAIKNANKVVIIGFSFTTNDKKARKEISEALKNYNNIEIEIVCGCYSENKKVYNFFKDKGIKEDRLIYPQQSESIKFENWILNHLNENSTNVLM